MMKPTPTGYHRLTGYDRHAMEPHALDWANQPGLYKSYPGIAPVELSEIQDLYPGELARVCAAAARPASQTRLDSEGLAKVLTLAAGLTGRMRQGGVDFYYRSAPSAGALYPNEVYLAWLGGSGLKSGIYHYGVHNRGLTPLREGNFSNIVCAAIPDPPAEPACVFMVTGIFFRSAWKYRERAYRYVLLDGGHLVENLRLALAAAGMAATLVFCFDDEALENLLGLDIDREGCIGCVFVHGSSPVRADQERSVSKLPEAIAKAGRVAEKEVIYPEILDIHRAGKKWVPLEQNPPEMASRIGVSTSAWEALPSGKAADAAQATDSLIKMGYAESVFRRRSRRNFIKTPMKRAQLNYLLDILCLAAGDGVREQLNYSTTVSVGVLAGNVEQMAPGLYLLDTQNRRIGKAACGHFIQEMSAVCLDQAWLTNAAVHFLFLSNLALVEQQWGTRGYRYAMMTAGRMGHGLYLGATAMKLGCCGIGAFYDVEAGQLLGLNSDSCLLYLVAAGPVKGVTPM